MNIPRQSASERIEAARKALSEWDEAYDGVPADLIDTDELSLASALRALITPPNVAESEKEAVRRVYMGIHSFPWLVDGDAMRDLIARGYRAGVQAAHERWEPADHPSQGAMLRWLGIEHMEFGQHLHIPEQDIEREED